MAALDISVVVPVRDEEQNIPELIGRLSATLAAMELAYELIFVTDVNIDRTMEVLRTAHQTDPRVKVIRLSNVYGQHIAAVAGLDACRGESVVLMDGDLQDHPEDISKLHARLQEGFDVVYGIKARKDEGFLRNMFSKAFVAVLNRLSDYPIEHNTSMFRIMSRRTVEQLRRFRESEQGLTGLVSLIGFPTDRVSVASGSRKAGRTKYSFFRQVNLAIGFILSFSTKPLRLASVLGLIALGASLVYAAVVIARAVYGYPIQGWAALGGLLMFLGGIQLLALGVIGEYLARIFIESKSRPIYIVDEKLGDLG